MVILFLICWLVFLFFGIYLFNFSIYPKVKEYSQNVDLPEERFGFTSDYFYEFLEKVGEAGQSTYLDFNFSII